MGGEVMYEKSGEEVDVVRNRNATSGRGIEESGLNRIFTCHDILRLI